MFTLNNLDMLLFDVINTLSENIVPKHHTGFWKASFGNINWKCLIYVLLNIFENLQNKCLPNVRFKQL